MKRTMRSTAAVLLMALSALMALLLIYPVRNGITRPSIILLSLSIYSLLIFMSWRKRRLRWGPIGVGVILLLFLILPGRKYAPEQLQSDYLSSLRAYTGTRYVWGGENRLGVDCSGLVRAAMVDTLFRKGFCTINPSLVREGLWLWWHDISAREMPSGYAGRMETVITSNSLRIQGSVVLHPGDAAVTGDGSHVIAYLGKDRWIEADPISLRVVEWGANDRPTSLDRPMTVVRWRYLE